MKCQTCRSKDAELLTRWEKVRNWLFLRVNTTLFPQDFDDLRSEKYTQGFSDGNVDGFNAAAKRFEAAQARIDVQTPTFDIEGMLEERLSNLLSPIDQSKVISLDKRGIIYLGGKPADDATMANLKSEAEFLLESDLWRVLHETPKELAQKAMFVAGESVDDMKKGRSMLYVLDTQRKAIDLLKSYEKR